MSNLQALDLPCPITMILSMFVNFNHVSIQLILSPKSLLSLNTIFSSCVVPKTSSLFEETHVAKFIMKSTIQLHFQGCYNLDFKIRDYNFLWLLLVRQMLEFIT